MGFLKKVAKKVGHAVSKTAKTVVKAPENIAKSAKKIVKGDAKGAGKALIGKDKKKVNVASTSGKPQTTLAKVTPNRVNSNNATVNSKSIPKADATKKPKGKLGRAVYNAVQKNTKPNEIKDKLGV